MTKCEVCGARVEPDQPTCAYCGAVTSFGIRKREAEEQARRAQLLESQSNAAQAEADARKAAEKEVQLLSKQAFVWSLVALPTCCLPVPSVVAIVLALRVKRVARSRGLIPPAQSTMALALGGMAAVMALSFYVFVAVSEREKSQRVSELERVAAGRVEAPVLDHHTACALAEIELLRRRAESFGSVSDVRCDGALAQERDHASLEDLRFHSSDSGEMTAVTHFKRGKRWMVDRIETVQAKTQPSSTGSGHGTR